MGNILETALEGDLRHVHRGAAQQRRGITQPPLLHPSTRRFPELLLDAGFNSNLAWNEDDFWFHVSTNACWGSGPDARWQQCGPPDGWQTTDFSQSQTTIEMQIPYARLGWPAGINQPIAIGWAVMQLAPDGGEVRAFWPETAVFDQPATWAQGTAVGGW